MQADEFTQDINQLWLKGDRKTAMYTLHAQLHQVIADQVESDCGRSIESDRISLLKHGSMIRQSGSIRLLMTCRNGVS